MAVRFLLSGAAGAGDGRCFRGEDYLAKLAPRPDSTVFFPLRKTGDGGGSSTQGQMLLVRRKSTRIARICKRMEKFRQVTLTLSQPYAGNSIIPPPFPYSVL